MSGFQVFLTANVQNFGGENLVGGTPRF